ncbi:hypothetical protein H4219_004014 [Mycoemilia scoparia]|uniref:Uncharacterized protein n=1 Tax=Mycoemilia scoparia TaxID=417184 RepID=A0A9W8DS39_9FUNG|nr:hypothetical protein H4219_004014 [Mycoemilia scoparia]
MPEGLQSRKKAIQSTTTQTSASGKGEEIYTMTYLETFTVRNYNPELWCQVGALFEYSTQHYSSILALVASNIVLLLITSVSSVSWVFDSVPISAGQNTYDRLLNFILFKLFSVRAVLDTEWEDLIIWACCYSTFGYLYLISGLCRDYLDYNNRYQVRARVQWRVVGTLIGLFSSTSVIGIGCYYYLKPLFSLLVIEALTILLDTAQTFVKYVSFASEFFVQTRGETCDDAVCLLEYLTDIGIILLSIAHYLHIFVISGFSLNIINVIFLLNVRSLFTKLNTKVCGLSAFRLVTQCMETQFPDATDKEIAEFDDTCSICCDTLDKAKKLPCSHLFHRRRIPSGDVKEWISQLSDASNEHGSDLVMATPGINSSNMATFNSDQHNNAPGVGGRF